VAVVVLVVVNLPAGSANDLADVRTQEAAPKKEAWRASGRHIAQNRTENQLVRDLICVKLHTTRNCVQILRWLHEKPIDKGWATKQVCVGLNFDLLTASLASSLTRKVRQGKPLRCITLLP
jgi:hypothetical protein